MKIYDISRRISEETPVWPGDTLDLDVGLFRGGERAKASGGGAAGDHVRVATLPVLP